MPGNTIDSLQRWMQQAIIDGTGAGIPTVVRSSDRMSAEAHLSIYRRSYHARLRECMQQQFPALAFALGPDLFRAFADEYLEVHASKSYTLNDLGRSFSAFLEASRPDADSVEKEWWPDFMVELADFEFALQEIFDAAQHDSISTVTVPLLRLFQHRFPICSYYLSFARAETPGLPLPAATFCAVARIDLHLKILPLAADEHAFLLLLQQGLSKQKAKVIFGENDARADACLVRLDGLGLFHKP